MNGISVLIPVFNRDVVPLIHQIKEALSFTSVAEIRVYDDASTDQMLALVNEKQLSSLQGLVYKSLAQNLGRSKIRNLLAKEATYDFLVFVDCDSALPDLLWTKRYWDQRVYPVQYGGTTYENSPVDKKYSLHHRIGNARETRLASERSSEPYRFSLGTTWLFTKKYWTTTLFQR